MSTPMQQQYERLKKKYNDCILLYRLGDFYECFDNDAKIISKVLNIVLTRRGKGDHERPMAGIPHHALDNYLPKLVKAGYKVAIAEQLEEPQKGKILVERDVIKVITAGTLTSDKLLAPGQNNYLASIACKSQKDSTMWALAVCDLTTGEFYINEFRSTSSQIAPEIIIEVKRLNVAELLVPEDLIPLFKKELQGVGTQKIDSPDYSLRSNKTLLTSHFGTTNLKGYGIEGSEVGIIAAGVLLKYLKDTQKVPLKHITKIYLKHYSNLMLLDENTIRSLELINPLHFDSKASLLFVLDKCETAMGKRKLYQWILYPLKVSGEIKQRLEAVSNLLKDTVKLKQIRLTLDKTSDIERICGKIGTESVNAKELVALKDSLSEMGSFAKLLSGRGAQLLKQIKGILTSSKSVQNIVKLINDSINEEPPLAITEGNLIKTGYDQEVDKLRNVTRDSKKWLSELQLKEAKRTGISSLKIKYNQVFGYYIEISKSNLAKVPDDYIRKQTLVNAERFITPELKEKEDIILHAEERLIAREYQIFIEVREKISKFLDEILTIALNVALLDVLANFAYLALHNNYVKPAIVEDESLVLDIKDGRHPVVEILSTEQFIPNDIHIDVSNKQIAIITGPNMAGKSTFIRQVALIVLMAQMGSFIPAKSALISPVDRIFTRVGASDNLAAGESTFLVEMNEAANILNNATKRSLVILDEVGRGTSTYDGVAIAWAVVNYIHDKIGAKTLFATHYHELIDLEKYLKRAFNLNVTVKETRNKIIFLRKIEKGGTDKSYGIQVAELAGIPQEVIQKSKEMLLSLEQDGFFEIKHIESELTPNKSNKNQQFALLTNLPQDPIIKELSSIDVNSLTPLDALQKLDEIVKKIKKK